MRALRALRSSLPLAGEIVEPRETGATIFAAPVRADRRATLAGLLQLSLVSVIPLTALSALVREASVL